MAIEKNVLEKCNLMQAVEWIAFGMPPKLEIHEFKEYKHLPINYIPAMQRAENALKYYLSTNKDQNIAIGIQYANKPMKNTTKAKIKLTDDGEFSYKNNSIIARTTRIPYYTNIEIDFSGLKRIFPHKDPDTAESNKNSVEKDFGRKTILTPKEITKLVLFAQSIAAQHTNQKRFMNICAKWVFSNFNKEISFTTIQEYLRPVLDQWKSDKKQKNGK